ncbi:TPA: hypothetical protein ACXE8V_004250 [Pluralibacter gergoviae]
MSFKKSKAAILLLITILFLSALLFLYKGWKIKGEIDYMDCKINMVTSNYGMTMPLVGEFRLTGNDGIIIFDGPVYTANQFKGQISRVVSFHGKIDNGVLSLKGTAMRRTQTDSLGQEQAEKMLPDFFVKSRSSISFRLLTAKGGYVFLKDSTPIFYCQNLL